MKALYKGGLNVKKEKRAKSGAKTSNTKTKGCGVWITRGITSAALWVTLIVLRACNVVGFNWLLVITGVIWIPVAVMILFLLAAASMIAFGRSQKRLRNRLRRRKTARKLWDAMEGLTLNNVGPIYGVRRQSGERNKDYKRRILRTARTLDVVNVQNIPAPATGAKLDAIAAKHGLKRQKKETDAQLQERIRMAILSKLEGGGNHGV